MKEACHCSGCDGHRSKSKCVVSAFFSFFKQGSCATDIQEKVQSDVCGFMEIISLGSSRFYVSFMDDKRRRIFIYFLALKSGEEILRVFNQFHSMVEREKPGQKFKILRADNVRELVNKAFKNRGKQFRIRHQRLQITPRNRRRSYHWSFRLERLQLQHILKTVLQPSCINSFRKQYYSQAGASDDETSS